ncbi:hypothetical protein [Burkholderia plantarii]|uniref:hypothetical protein n=1 Tax=Burkholderia plantarii TaxID=41899 RepID=UPI0018DE5C65|nr:hypothetical protein [Burkholderia plantarii]MBI0329291.1 hypothetical protein [Burkholderia plantarii]
MGTNDLAARLPPQSACDASQALTWDEAETGPVGSDEDGSESVSDLSGDLSAWLIEIDEPDAADPPVYSIAEVMTLMESCRQPACLFYLSRTW